MVIKMGKLSFLIVVFLLVFSLSLMGQSKVGTAGFQFLKIAPSARAAAMSSAFSAIADDASALYYNPAGIAHLKKYELLTNGIEYPAGIKLAHASVVVPVSPLFGNIGFSFTSLFLDEAMKVTEPMLGGEYGNWTGEWFLSYMYTGQISYARSLTDRFSTGISLRYVRSTLDDRDNTSSQAIAGDIGTLYDTQFKTIKLGIVVSNFGPDAAYKSIDAEDAVVKDYDHESFPLPMNFRVSVSAVPFDMGANKVIMDIEGEHPNDNYERAYLGLEYSFNDMFFLRSGYKVGADAETWSAGGGINVPIAVATLKVDAAYTDYTYLNNIKRISVSLLF
jgi:hypothetical protein